MGEVVDIKQQLQDEKERLKRQIEKANQGSETLDNIVAVPSEYPNREEAEKYSVDLAEMNHKYAFVHSLGGKPMVKCLVYNEFFDKEIIEFVTIESITSRYLNRLAVETTMDPRKMGIQIGKWWLGHQHRKDYETVTFEPDKVPGEYHIKDKFKFQKNEQGEDKYKTYFNMWEGFGIVPKQGNWKRICKHIYTVLCNKDITKFNYVMRWFAWSVQYPGQRAEVALIFKGKKGAGKGVILQSFVKIFGRHGMAISNREHLVGKHNAHLSTCSFLLSDEAYHPGDKEVEGILKNIITEPSLTTEPKFQGLKIGKNCLHIVMSTNADWVIPATEDERRYFINEVDNSWAKGSCPDTIRENYFDKLYEEIACGGLEAMLYDLLKINLTDWHPRKAVPETEELRKQIAMSLPKIRYAFMVMLDDGIFPGSMDGQGRYMISNANLTEFLQNMESGNKVITGKQTAKLCQELDILQHRDGKRGRFYLFPELGTLRELWHTKITKNTEWRTNEQWTVASQF